MEDARRQRKCIFGRAKAREEIWKHVGPETIIIGHAAHNDLVPLRWIHTRVVDTLLVEEAVSRRQEQLLFEYGEEQDEQALAAEPPAASRLSLKVLASERLGREVQTGGQGHDSLEDAMATRDVLHWHIDRALKAAARGKQTSERWDCQSTQPSSPRQDWAISRPSSPIQEWAP
jgi:RNA exonuclease 1